MLLVPDNSSWAQFCSKHLARNLWLFFSETNFYANQNYSRNEQTWKFYICTISGAQSNIFIDSSLHLFCYYALGYFLLKTQVNHSLSDVQGRIEKMKRESFNTSFGKSLTKAFLMLSSCGFQRGELFNVIELVDSWRGVFETFSTIIILPKALIDKVFEIFNESNTKLV